MRVLLLLALLSAPALADPPVYGHIVETEDGPVYVTEAPEVERIPGSETAVLQSVSDAPPSHAAQPTATFNVRAAVVVCLLSLLVGVLVGAVTQAVTFERAAIARATRNRPPGHY